MDSKRTNGLIWLKVLSIICLFGAIACLTIFFLGKKDPSKANIIFSIYIRVASDVTAALL